MLATTIVPLAILFRGQAGTQSQIVICKYLA
jgi:hypothetical protein